MEALQISYRLSKSSRNGAQNNAKELCIILNSTFSVGMQWLMLFIVWCCCYLLPRYTNYIAYINTLLYYACLFSAIDLKPSQSGAFV